MHKMARRKANGLENQMSLMDMMASESPEYAEEDPAELLDTGEDMGDSEGQTISHSNAWRTRPRRQRRASPHRP